MVVPAVGGGWSGSREELAFFRGLQRPVEVAGGPRKDSGWYVWEAGRPQAAGYTALREKKLRQVGKGLCYQAVE